MDVQNTHDRLRIGIWLKYHVTLEASEGIGVFAHNLARGLSRLPGGPEVMLAIHAGDEKVVQDTVDYGQGRIVIGATTARRPHRSLSYRSLRIIQKASGQFSRLLARAGQRVSLVKYPAALSERFTSWLLEKSLRGEQLAGPDEHTRRLIEECDVWLVPYVGLSLRFDCPSVVAIHDLIPYHFPDICTPEALLRFKSLAPQVAEHATVAACMSEFIRKNDLEGILHLPKNKTRMVPPAVPSDFGQLGDYEAASVSYPILRERYLFYPAAFRKYKNHALLIRALAELHARGDQDLHLVFTGISKTPPELLALIDDLQLSERVQVLRKVDRPTLALLYRHACATVVPSLYEQGSFPLMEALHWGCPIACSRIPALTEFFAPMLESVAFFDPLDEINAADVIAGLLAHRDEVSRKQQAGYRRIGQRTWVDAARDWMEVFEYAIECHNHRESLPMPTPSASRAEAA